MAHPNFFSELKRRNVYKVAVAYGVVAWLLIQIATATFPVLEIPNIVTKLVIVVVILGFPIALVVAWAFEMTPEGMKRTDEVQHEGLPRWSRKKFIALIAIVAMAAGSLLIWQLLRGSGPGSGENQPATAAQKSIAVLPLLNESGDPKDEYFSDGLSEELIAALSHIGELKVIGRSSSFRFKDRKEDSKTIGQKLGVTSLLEGTVRKQGNKVRIVAELVNAADGISLWTETFDRELKDIFAVQEEIAAAVAASLKTTLLGPEQGVAANRGTRNTEAHDAYLLGHFYFQRHNLEDYRTAVSRYDEAIRLDPDYALAYAERSEVWTLIGNLIPEGNTWQNARTDAEKAVASAPGLAEAHAALGWVRFFAEWKFTEGLRELKRAKELAPANPTANDLLARVIVYLGKLDEAESQARQAVELDPLAMAVYNNLARVLWYEGKLDEAQAAGRKCAELQPNSASSRRWQVLVAVRRGDGDTAVREAQAEPDERYRVFEVAIAQEARGDRATADAALADLIANNRGLDYQVAQVYAVRGDKEKALEWLQVAFDHHDTGMLALLVEPLFHGLRDDPRYKTLVAKMNFPPTP